MSPLIQIKCPNRSPADQEKLRGFVATIITEATQMDILPKTIKEIVVCDDYKKQYEEIAAKFGMKTILKSEHEYESIAKVCFDKNDSETSILLLHSVVFCVGNPRDTVNRIFLEAISENHLPEEYKKGNVYYYNSSISQIAQVIFPRIFASIYAQVRMPLLEEWKNKQPPLSPAAITTLFKRKVKRLHHKFQSDNDFEACVMEYYGALRDFLCNYIDICFYKATDSQLEEFTDMLIEFKDNLSNELQTILAQKPHNLDFLKKVMIKVSEICFFRITEQPNNIRIFESPKKLFPNLLDTHNRIVAFVDILGFSQMIKEFDKNDDIPLLTDLKKALDTAIDYMQQNYKYAQGEIETKLFSDCLCLSTSYFDNKTDFPYQFGIVMLGLNIYQALLLQKGYLVRGGIAIGSYYSDKNMIFSGALVDAVQFEKNGSTSGNPSNIKPPRILVSPKILEKLDKSTVHDSLKISYQKGLIRSNDMEVFISPFIDIDASKKILESVVSKFDSDDVLSGLLSRMMNTSMQLLNLHLTPDLQNATNHDILNQIEERINKHANENFVSKYIWMRNLIEWNSNNYISNEFDYYQVEFL